MGSDELFTKRKKQNKRKIGQRGNPKDRILIVCEGQRTEPYYFEGFRLTNVRVEGFGYNTDSLVEKAIELKNRAKGRDEEYQQVWCVFDRDTFPAKNFNRAFELARSNGIQIVYSNEAFELWYLLHFHYYNTAISRESYCTKLTQLLEHKYAKNSTAMYADILHRQPTAIQNAMRLAGENTRQNPEMANPSTTVHLLVQELNKWLK